MKSSSTTTKRAPHASLKIVVLGLSITSSWGNGHATTYRSLLRELAARGHNILFLERDVPWYAENRDLPRCTYAKIGLYRNLKQLQTQFGQKIREADLIIVGSHVPDGIYIGEYVNEYATGITAFYDIDTPITLAKIEQDECDYLSRELIAEYRLYLSFTGGPTLNVLQKTYGSPMSRALYCSVDPKLYFPERRRRKWAMGYLGTYSDDHHPALEALMLRTARHLPREKFIVAGPQYPEAIRWPENVVRVVHLAPTDHRAFYSQQKFTLNITRTDMKKVGYSPSVRLFEAAACGTPIISDYWDGLNSIFEIGKEILVARSTRETMAILSELSAKDRSNIGQRARERILTEHTAAHRALDLESYVGELTGQVAKTIRIRGTDKSAHPTLSTFNMGS